MATVLERRIKKLLDDITDVAMKDEPEAMVKRYKDYQILMQAKEKDSSNGMWHGPREKQKAYIEVYNTWRGASEIAGTCLHELAHQCDYVRNGKTGHKKPFYDAYAQLIYASLDMGILEVSDFQRKFSADAGKVLAIVGRYKPNPIKYGMNDFVIVKVRNCYEHKEELKKNGYGWNPLEFTWEKDASDPDGEERFLQGMGAVREEEGAKNKSFHYAVVKYGMYVDAPFYVEAIGDTYQNKEALKNRGFVYNAVRKSWVLRCKTSEWERTYEELNKLFQNSNVIFRKLKVNK